MRLAIFSLTITCKSSWLRLCLGLALGLWSWGSAPLAPATAPAAIGLPQVGEGWHGLEQLEAVLDGTAPPPPVAPAASATASAGDDSATPPETLPPLTLAPRPSSNPSWQQMRHGPTTSAEDETKKLLTPRPAMSLDKTNLPWQQQRHADNHNAEIGGALTLDQLRHRPGELAGEWQKPDTPPAQKLSGVRLPSMPDVGVRPNPPKPPEKRKTNVARNVVPKAPPPPPPPMAAAAPTLTPQCQAFETQQMQALRADQQTLAALKAAVKDLKLENQLSHITPAGVTIGSDTAVPASSGGL